MAIIATPEEKAHEQYLENPFLNNGDKRFSSCNYQKYRNR